MTRLLKLDGLKRRRCAPSAFGFVLAAFALWIRLAVPLPLPVENADNAASAAFLTEHALCLSEAAAGDPGAIPPVQLPGQPADHSGHRDCVCCPWHAGAGLVMARDVPIVSIAFAEITVAATPPEPLQPPVLRSGPVGARAPPHPETARPSKPKALAGIS